MNMKKTALAGVCAAAMTISMGLTAFGGQWRSDTNGWWYQNEDGSYPADAWQWIDGNSDGAAECYFFDSQGYCMTNTVTPDGSTVNEYGAWTINGTVQVKAFPRGSGATDGIRSEFKKALDTYEQFFDEDYAFMNRYSNSGYSPEMMGDYLTFLSKYQEAMDSLNRLDNQELNNSELLYYLEVTERITQKLTEVSL